MKKVIFLLAATILILVISKESNAQKIDGTYSVGKTSAYILMNLGNGAGIVKWKMGTGVTELNYAGQDDDGNEVWKEYAIGNGNKKYTGKFVFYDYSLSEGYYLRKDGKTFDVSLK